MQGGISTKNLEHRRRFLLNAAYAAAIAGLVFLTFRYLLSLIGPFVAAYFFSWLLSPIIRRLTVRHKMKYRLAAALCLAVFFALLGGLAVLLTTRLVALAARALPWLPTLYSDAVAPGLEQLSLALEELAARFGPAAAELADTALPTVTASIGSAVTSASMGLVTLASGWAAKLPSCLVSALVCVVATVFMTLDFHRITAFLLRQLPARPRHIIREARDACGEVLRKYGRGCALIMGITFLETLAGLLLLGQKNALTIALGIAVFDIFPILGAGMILVPWGILCLLSGAAVRGVGLLVLYLVEITVRQCIEPRIVGRQIGLHPLLTLASMFVGSKLFGVVGLLGLPLTCAIAASLEDAGVIRLLRHDTDEEK